MGFDLYFGTFHHDVGHHEEWVLDQVVDDESFPKICWLRSQWFDDPKITPSECNDLVHELIELYHRTADRYGRDTIHKLMLFLSRAYRSNAIVECNSD